METQTTIIDSEIAAINEVFNALKGLEKDAQKRVIDYVSKKFDIQSMQIIHTNRNEETINEYKTKGAIETTKENESEENDELEGISPAGRKWMARNGIPASKLMSLYSLGLEEIDLVAKSVTGTTKAQRMRNVFLLKGMAAYLGEGIAKFSHEQIKEACFHYDAFDGANFATIYKTMAPDVSGTKTSGYTLSAKGISEATKLIKEIAGITD